MSRPTASGSLHDQGTAWLSFILSGDATQADAAALASWRAEHPDHDRAFRTALRMLRAVEQAGILYRERAAASEGDAAIDGPGGKTGWRPGIRLPVSRRGLLAGGVAGTAALVLAVQGGLFAEAGQYRTGTGERRKLALGPGLTVEMNTRTSLSVERKRGEYRIRLIRGQALVAAALPAGERVSVVARDGRATAQAARFDVRDYEGEDICVTCVAGTVEVVQGGAARQLAANQSVTYDDRGVAEPVPVDPAVATAWQRGMLIFHDRPLRAVIAEVNRYRPGRIWVATDAVGAQLVDAVFYLDRMQDVVPQVQQLSGARVTTLVGGNVILS